MNSMDIKQLLSAFLVPALLSVALAPPLFGESGPEPAVPASVSVGPRIEFPNHPSAYETTVDIAMAHDGGVMAIWQEDPFNGADPSTLYMGRFSPAGWPVGAVKVVGEPNAERAAMATRSDGNFVLVWQTPGDSGDIKARRYDSVGDPVGVALWVNADTTGKQQAPSVAMEADGDFLVVWSDNSTGELDHRIRGRRFNSNGATIGGEITIDSGSGAPRNHSAVASRPEGGFVIAWADGRDFSGNSIFGGLFDADVAPVSGVLVLGEGEFPYAAGEPDLLVKENGDFVVAWQSSYVWYGAQIRGTRFDSQGAVQGSFEAGNFSAYQTYTSPNMAPAPDGGFVVVWASTRLLGGYSHWIRVRSVGADGSLIEEFDIPGGATGSRVAAAGDDFVVMWNGGGPKAQRYTRQYLFTGDFESGDFVGWSSVSP